jgi:VanZ family protein
VSKFRAFLKFWLPVVLLMTLIFSASSDSRSYEHSRRLFGLFEPFLHWLFPQMHPEQITNIHHLFRKSAHIVEYAVLALLLWRAIRHTCGKTPRPPVAPKRSAGGWNWAEARLALLIVMLFAATDEFHQLFVPDRTSLVSDVFVDTCGGAVALFALWIYGRCRKRW